MNTGRQAKQFFGAAVVNLEHELDAASHQIEYPTYQEDVIAWEGLLDGDEQVVAFLLAHLHELDLCILEHRTCERHARLMGQNLARSMSRILRIYKDTHVVGSVQLAANAITTIHADLTEDAPEDKWRSLYLVGMSLVGILCGRQLLGDTEGETP